MTQDELIAALPAGRLPPELLQVGWTDLLALFGAGLVLAALLAALARPLAERRPSVAARVRATRGMAAPDRLLAVARILGHLPQELREAAYRGEPIADQDIERAALRAGRRRR